VLYVLRKMTEGGAQLVGYLFRGLGPMTLMWDDFDPPLHAPVYGVSHSDIVARGPRQVENLPDVL
jgi:hypothetical protein